MKRPCTLSVVAALAVAGLAVSASQAQIRISQVYTVGGGAAGIYQRDFVELFNAGGSIETLTGAALAYSSATGNSWSNRVNLPEIVLQPGQYYLIVTGTAAGTGLVQDGDLTLPTNQGINLSASSGKLVLISDATADLTGNVCPVPSVGAVLDFVGYGTTANCAEGTVAPATNSAQPSQQALFRGGAGCTDTGDNAADFTLGAPNPRRMSSPTNPCVAGALDLALSSVVAAPASPVVPGTPVTYTVTYGNVGSTTVNGVNVTVTLPADVQFIGSSVPGTTINGARTVTLPLGSLPGATTNQTFTLQLQPDGAYPASAPLSLVFSINPSAGDVNTSNNSVTAPLTVVANANLNIAFAGPDGPCVIQPAPPAGPVLTYVVTVNNPGPSTAAAPVVRIPLPEALAFGAAAGGTPGSVGFADGEVTWTLPNLPAGQSAMLSFTASPVGSGSLNPVATLSSTTLDPALSDNAASATPRHVALDLADPSPVLFSSVTTAGASIAASSFTQFAIPPFAPGIAQFLGTGFAFGRPAVSPDGTKWAATVETTLANPESQILIAGDFAGSTPVVRAVAKTGIEISTGGTVGSGTTLPIFGRALAINDAGQIAYTSRATLPPLTEGGVPRAGWGVFRATPGESAYVLEKVAFQGENLPSSTGVLVGQFGGTPQVAGISATGAISFYTNLGGAPAASNEVLLADDGAVLLALEGTTSPTNSVSGLTGPYRAVGTSDAFNQGTDSDFGRRNFKITPNGATSLFDASLGDLPTGQQRVTVLGGDVRIQEGFVLPGSGFTRPVEAVGGAGSTPTLTAGQHLADDGTWFAFGVNAPEAPGGPRQGWVVRNGAVVARTGDPITAAAGETERWSNQVLGQTFSLATGNATSYVVGGLTDRNDPTTDGVIVHNGERVVLREGDPIDLGPSNDGSPYVPDANGIPGNIVFAGPIFQNNRAFIDAGNNLNIIVQYRTSSYTCNLGSGTGANPDILGQAWVRIPLGPVAPTGCNVADIVSIGGFPPADGELTVDDYTSFINAFAGDELLADIVSIGGFPPADGELTVDDYTSFINAFAEGC